MKRCWWIAMIIAAALLFAWTGGAGGKTKSLRQLADTLVKSTNPVAVRFLTGEIAKSEPRTDQDIDAVVRLVLSQDESISSCGVMSLSSVSTGNLFSKMVSLLNDYDDEKIRGAVIASLSKMKDKRAVPVLVECLDDEGRTANQAASALVTIGDGQAIPALLAQVQKKGCSLGYALAAFGADALTAIAERLEIITDEEERMRVIQTIGFIRDPQAIGILKLLLKNRDANVRSMSVQALEGMNDISVIDALQDADAGVRAFAVESLQHMDDTRINDALIDAFNNDNDAGVRIACAKALGSRQCKAALPSLREALQDRSNCIQEAAAAAIEAVNRQPQ